MVDFLYMTVAGLRGSLSVDVLVAAVAVRCARMFCRANWWHCSAAVMLCDIDEMMLWLGVQVVFRCIDTSRGHKNVE